MAVFWSRVFPCRFPTTDRIGREGKRRCPQFFGGVCPLSLWLQRRENAEVMVWTRAALTVNAELRISPSSHHGEDETCVHLAGLGPARLTMGPCSHAGKGSEPQIQALPAAALWPANAAASL